MKFCRFISVAGGENAELPHYGILDGDHVQQLVGFPWTEWSSVGKPRPLALVRLLTPVEPRKIVCVGRNYAAHAAELGNEMPKEPLIFLKPSTSILGPSGPIILPRYSQRVEHEGELGMVIGRTCAHLNDQENPLAYVLGYTCVNDVTARDLQKSDV